MPVGSRGQLCCGGRFVEVVGRQPTGSRWCRSRSRPIGQSSSPCCRSLALPWRQAWHGDRSAMCRKRQDNKAVVRRFAQACSGRGMFDVAAELVAPDVSRNRQPMGRGVILSHRGDQVRPARLPRPHRTTCSPSTTKWRRTTRAWISHRCALFGIPVTARDIAWTRTRSCGSRQAGSGRSGQRRSLCDPDPAWLVLAPRSAPPGP